MPRALEICRSFLMQSQPQETRLNNVIKPIPSRKLILPHHHQQIYAPIFSNLQKSEETPFKTVTTTEKPEVVVISAVASTSKIPEDETKKPQPETSERKQEKRHLKKREGGGTSNKVIIDIACCDGPVRFHRVINKNYGHPENISESDAGGEEDIATTTPINRNEVLNKIMNETMRDKKIINNENQQQQQPQLPQQNNNELFTCLYCNHTFKSQYCYQKHARRHLNPVSLENKNLQKITETNSVISTKREVKLLDMNVQYYPCKTCGSKFPSYYFVHKHRKLCHPEEMADSNNKNNEMVVVQSSNTNQSENNSENSAVDVENDMI